MPVRPRPALAAALGCAVALCVEGLLAFHWTPVRSADARSLAGFYGLTASPHLTSLAQWIAGAATPASYAALGAVIAAVALVRRQPRLALALPCAMAGASVTAELFKHLFAAVRHSHWLVAGDVVGSASWPSGHATAAMAVALCAIAVAPASLRPLVALLGCALAVAVGDSILVLAWHFPSDVVGGYLLAACWVSLALAAVARSERGSRGRAGVERPAPRSAVLGPAALVAAAACAFAVRASVTPFQEPVGGALVAGALVVALVAAALTAGIALALRGAGRRSAARAADRPVASSLAR